MGTSQVSVARVRVRYAETDQMNVVYYANYFVWFEVGRTELLRGLGWSYREMEAEGYSLPVIEASCQYLRPSHYDDELQITTTGTLCRPCGWYSITRSIAGRIGSSLDARRTPRSILEASRCGCQNGSGPSSHESARHGSRGIHRFASE